jgi:hypothetical protein
LLKGYHRSTFYGKYNLSSIIYSIHTLTKIIPTTERHCRDKRNQKMMLQQRATTMSASVRAKHNIKV